MMICQKNQKDEDIFDNSAENIEEARDNLLKLLEEGESKQGLYLD